MAFFPCDQGKHRHKWRSATFYVAVLAGSVQDRTRVRLCPQHALALAEQLRPYLIDGEPHSNVMDDRAARCPTCQGMVENGHGQLFVTAYLSGEDRADFWAPMHDHCSRPSMFPPGEQLIESTRLAHG